MKHQCLKMMEPSEHKGNFISNIKVYVRGQDSTTKLMSLGKNNEIHCRVDIEFPLKNKYLLAVCGSLNFGLFQ